MIDHLVYATPDLAATAEHLGHRLGITLSPGGRHIGLGSRNYLADLGGGSYLEVIGPDPEQPESERRHPFGIDQISEPRLLTWAAQMSGLPDVIERARAAGYDPGSAMPMSRGGPDGVTLEWQVTLPTAESEGGLVPFLIDWGGSPHPSETATRGVRLESLTGAHPDPARVRAKLAALGVELLVTEGPRPALRAVLRGPTGDVVLQ